MFGYSAITVVSSINDFEGIAVHMLTSLRPKSGWPACSRNCAHLQNGQRSVQSVGSRMDSEVCNVICYCMMYQQTPHWILLAVVGCVVYLCPLLILPAPVFKRIFLRVKTFAFPPLNASLSGSLLSSVVWLWHLSLWHVVNNPELTALFLVTVTVIYTLLFSLYAVEHFNSAASY